MTCGCGSRRSSIRHRTLPPRNRNWPNSARGPNRSGWTSASSRATYDNWKAGILNDFDGRTTSAAVEGIHHKARVITQRCTGVKSSDTLWNRLILDLNRASEAVGQTIAQLRGIVGALKAVFLAFCT